MKKIVITISEETGEVEMEGVGFKGQACDKAMAEIEKALGVQTARKNKPEYHSLGTVTGQQKVGGA